MPLSLNRNRHAALGVVALFCLPISAAVAQEPPPTPPPTAAAAGAVYVEAQATLVQINDLSILRDLNPLKLTKEQIDTFLAVMRAIAADGEKRRKQDADALRVIAPEIRAAYETAVGGGVVPAALDTRVRQVFQESAARLAAARRNAIGRLLIVAREDLTPAQKDNIEALSVKTFGGKRIPKEYQKDPSKAPREVVQDLALAAFIEQVLLSDRAIEVLAKVKPAASAAAAASEPPTP